VVLAIFGSSGTQPTIKRQEICFRVQVALRPGTAYSIKSTVENAILGANGVHSIGAGIRGRLGRAGLSPFRWLER
jgi:hypothetical protein